MRPPPTMLAASRLLCRRFASSTSQTVDRFAMLGVERRFDLDATDLHASYKALMSQLHPDRLATASADEQRAAAEQASSITDAYAELKQPHLRASHLLELAGQPLNEEDGANGLLPPAFLMEVMELREELEDAPDVGRLAQLQERNQAQMEALGSELALAFASQQMEPARKLTAQLQYLNRIGEEIDAQTPLR